MYCSPLTDQCAPLSFQEKRQRIRTQWTLGLVQGWVSDTWVLWRTVQHYIFVRLAAPIIKKGEWVEWGHQLGCVRLIALVVSVYLNLVHVT
jgi:hypothetical protein